MALRGRATAHESGRCHCARQTAHGEGRAPEEETKKRSKRRERPKVGRGIGRSRREEHGEPQRSRALEDDQHAAQDRERLPKQAQVERGGEQAGGEQGDAAGEDDDVVHLRSVGGEGKG